MEASGDEALSFEKGGVSFDTLDDAGKLIDRKYGHGRGILKRQMMDLEYNERIKKR